MRAYSYTAITGIAQATSIGFYLLVARALDPSAYGDAMAVVTVSLLVSGLLNFGGNTFFVRELAAVRIGRTELGVRFAGRILFSVLVSGVLGFVLSITIGQGDWRVGIGALALTFSSHLAQMVLVLPISNQQLIVAGMSTFAEKFLPLFPAYFLMVSGKLSAIYVPYLIALGCVLGVVITVCFTRGAKGLVISWLSKLLSPPVVLSPEHKLLLLNPWKRSVSIGLSSVAFSLQQLDVIITRYSASATVAGEYAAISRWTQPVSLLASSLGQAILPKMSRAVNIKGAVATLVALWPMAAAIAVAAVMAAAVSDSLVTVLLGSAYAGAGAALAIFFLAMPISFIRQLMYLLLVSRQIDVPCARLVTVSTSVYLIGLPFLSWILGSVGAASAFAAYQSLMLAGFIAIIVFSARKETAL